MAGEQVPGDTETLSRRSIEYLGHAGFVVRKDDVRVLVDPWFHTAFFASWFPYPDNRHVEPSVRESRFDFLYISHLHEDHFDVRTLEHLDRTIEVLVPDYRSGGMVRALNRLGFETVRVLGHLETTRLSAGFDATMILDTSHKEDSGVLFDLDGFRFLDLNDCNTALPDLPGDIDLVAAQFSGAMWYPNCYGYPADRMQQKTDAVRSDIANTLIRKLEVTDARAYLPSAGPPIFLDPALERFNDRPHTIFPLWDDVAGAFAEACPDVRVIRLDAGDRIEIADAPSDDPDDWPITRCELDPPDSSLAAYRQRCYEQWREFYELDATPVTTTELQSYFETLQNANRRFLGAFAKDVTITTPDRAWLVRLGAPSDELVTEVSVPQQTPYSISLPNAVLRAIVDGRTGWEESLLSLRLALTRDPDVFDLVFMSLLRYGNEPTQTRQMIRERENSETIERDGLRLQRWCPHAGEDLTLASIEGGVLECPRHHWKWDVATGRCLEGGDVPLRVTPIESIRGGRQDGTAIIKTP